MALTMMLPSAGEPAGVEVPTVRALAPSPTRNEPLRVLSIGEFAAANRVSVRPVRILVVPPVPPGMTSLELVATPTPELVAGSVPSRSWSLVASCSDAPTKPPT